MTTSKEILKTKLKDEEVIARVLNGEKPLYEIIIRRYNPYLYKVGRSYNYGHEDTEDLMQDSFVDAYQNLSKFEGRSAFKTWIIRIMLNNCYRKKNKASFKNETATELYDNSKPMFSSSDDQTDRKVHSHELRHIIESALSEIPYDYRMVFSLREITGLSTSETAGLMNISEANVKVRLNRAKSKLRDQIEKSYTPSELYDFNLIYCDAIVENVMNRINEF